MKTITQLEFVKKELKERGKISRNYCLENYITRLGARINDLQNAGWNIQGEWVKTEHGKDYVYHLISRPLDKRVSRVVDGKAVICYE